MGWNNHILTTPFVKTRLGGGADLQLAVGTSSVSHLAICRGEAGTINKWAKYKPSNHPAVVGPLTDSQRKFGANDGTRWGLAVTITGTNPGTLSQIHNSSFDYTGRPTSTNGAPCRVSDFVSQLTPGGTGYSDTAIPNPGMAVIAENLSLPIAFVDIAQGLTFNGGYNVNNATGVDIADMVFGTNEALDLTKVYPCILCGSYLTALRSMEDGQVHPLKVSDSNYPGTWYADFSKPVYGTSSKPFAAGQNLTCSIIAVQLGNNTFDQTTLAALSSSWILDSVDQVWLSKPASPIPISNTSRACGITIQTANASSAGMIVEPAGVSFTSTQLKVTLSIANAEASSAYSVKATIGDDSPTKSLVIRAGQTSTTATYTLSSDFPNTLFVTGQTYTFTIEVYKSGQLHRSATFSIVY